LAHDPPASYVSIKLPALRFSRELLREVAEKAMAPSPLPGGGEGRSSKERAVFDHGTRSAPTTWGRRLHFDSLAPETVERTQQMIDELLADLPGLDVGCTLPGRWRRSVEDAHWAARRDLFVRVVKGQWADPEDPNRDAGVGYLEVINQLAGRARRVAVATHDVALAAEAVRRLRAARTPCELELLYGLPMRQSIKQARELGVGVRIYVPYGETYLPYALSQVRRRPRVLWWLVKDAVASLFSRAWIATREEN
jgi:proline dehydrogenase